MTPKEYLSQYRDKVLEIKVMEESIRELEDRATSVTASTDSERVQGSGSKDKIGNIVSKIADMQGECRTKMNEALELREKIESEINRMETSDYRAILHLRYIGGLEWQQIANRMIYHKRWVQVLHGRALQEFEKIKETEHPSASDKLI